MQHQDPHNTEECDFAVWKKLNGPMITRNAERVARLEGAIYGGLDSNVSVGLQEFMRSLSRDVREQGLRVESLESRQLRVLWGIATLVGVQIITNVFTR